MTKEELNNLHLNTIYKDINLSVKCDELCKYYLDILEDMKGLQGARGTKSVFITPIEEEFISSFCEANSTNISDLIRLSFFTDGAIPEALIIAISKTPKAVLTFLDLNKESFSFDYLDKWENFTVEDFKEAFSKPGKTKPIRDRSLVIEETEKHRKQRGFPSWAYYAKQGMLDLGVYPSLAVDVAKSHLRVISKDIKYTDAQLKAKKKRQEKAALAKRRGVSDPKQKVRSVKLAITALPFEQSIIQPFIDALRGKGLSLSSLAKYTLLEHGIIDDTMLKMDEATKEKCSKFLYERPISQGTKLFYENQQNADRGKKRHINNISVLSEARDAIFKHNSIGRGSFAAWIREYLLEAHHAYPLAADTKTTTMEIFQS